MHLEVKDSESIRDQVVYLCGKVTYCLSVICASVDEKTRKISQLPFVPKSWIVFVSNMTHVVLCAGNSGLHSLVSRP